MLEAKLATEMACHLGDELCLTLDQLSSELDWKRSQTHITARCLLQKGLLERVEEGCYRLTAAGRELVKGGDPVMQGPFKTPHIEASEKLKDTLFQRSWNAMRLMNSFTASDLALVAAKKTETNAVQTIGRFLHRLSVTGYLHEFPKRKNNFKRYRLLKDTGELAPAFVKTGGVFDRNEKELRV